MNKQSLLWVVLICLMILNLALLAFIFWNTSGPKHKKNGREAPEAFIGREFNLSETELETFVASKKSHIEAARKIALDLEKSSVKYYTTQNDQEKQDHLDALLRLSKEMYEVNAKHLADLKDLVGDGKEEELQRFIENLTGAAQAHRHRPPRHRK